MQKIIYYGAVDVDDSHFNVALINPRNGELFHFKCCSNVEAMIKKIRQKILNLKISNCAMKQPILDTPYTES